MCNNSSQAVITSIDMTSLRSKILTSYGLSKAALLVFVAIVIADLHYLQTHIVEGVAVNNLSEAIQKIRRDEKNLFLYHNPDDLTQLRQQLAIAFKSLDEGKTVFASIAEPEELQKMQDVLSGYSQKIDAYSKLTPDSRGTQQEQIRNTGHLLSVLTQELGHNQRRVLTNTASVATRTLLVASVTVILLGFASAMYMVRHIVRPIRQLEHQLDQLAEGNAQALTLDVNATEIQSFVFHFNSMLEQLREQQMQARRNERAAALGVLVSGVAHELNNPLSNISTSVQLLKEDDGTTREDLRKQWLEHIDGETDRARRIVRRLLDSVRQPAAHMDFLGAAKLVQGAVLLIHRLLPHDFFIHIEDIEDSNLLVDRERMQQVFINLIKNANHAGAKNIWITGKETSWSESKPLNSNNLAGDTTGIGQFSNVMLIHVDDDGPGISAEDMPKVFDPFFTTQAGGEGTGLGLYLVEEIINEHGGCIAVENAPQGGARFSIWLPVKQIIKNEQESS